MFVNALHGQSLTLTKAIREVSVCTRRTRSQETMTSSPRSRPETWPSSARSGGVQAIAGVLKTTTCMVLAD